MAAGSAADFISDLEQIEFLICKQKATIFLQLIFIVHALLRVIYVRRLRTEDNSIHTDLQNNKLVMVETTYE